MKKLFCFLLCLTLIFSNISLCFATAVDWDSSDSQHLTEIRNTLMSGGAIYNLISAVNSNVNLLNSNLVTLMGWLDPSTGGSTTALLNRILSMLSYTDAGGALKSWLADIWQNEASINSTLYNFYNLGFIQDVSPVTVSYGKDSTSIGVGVITLPWNQAILYSFNELRGSLARNYVWTNDKMFENSESTQTYTNWSTLNNSTFSAASGIDGIYKWLSNIQTPVARLSYVLASDERIDAQEAAAANEEAVVDNFIDSSGDGAASPSDIGSVSDLSSGYKQNFGTDASPSGIFDIFNSDHASWFSQETKNQLDTTTPTRLTRGSESETPLLDKQIDDIYNALGVKQP